MSYFRIIDIGFISPVYEVSMTSTLIFQAILCSLWNPDSFTKSVFNESCYFLSPLFLCHDSKIVGWRIIKYSSTHTNLAKWSSMREWILPWEITATGLSLCRHKTCEFKAWLVLYEFHHTHYYVQLSWGLAPLTIFSSSLSHNMNIYMKFKDSKQFYLLVPSRCTF